MSHTVSFKDRTNNQLLHGILDPPPPHPLGTVGSTIHFHIKIKETGGIIRHLKWNPKQYQNPGERHNKLKN